MTAAEILGASGAAEFTIATPTAGSLAEALKLLENANQDLMKRLDIANEKIVELAMKNSALQTELNMRKQIEEMKVELAVDKAKREWETEWEQDTPSGIASSAGIRHCPLGLGDLEAAVRSDAAYGAGIRELEDGSW